MDYMVTKDGFEISVLPVFLSRRKLPGEFSGGEKTDCTIGVTVSCLFETGYNNHCLVRETISRYYFLK